MIVDANLLIYAINESASAHIKAKTWLEEQLNGEVRIGLPWPSLLAFMRLSTSLRIAPSPISGKQAWNFVRSWLESPVAWVPPTTQRHVAIFGQLMDKYELSGNLIPDGHLAAFAVEHNVPIASADSDFARFGEVRWLNPLTD